MRTPSTRRALEDALAHDPDDLSAHSAYADLLMEEGDPRGEFIQVQLALERAGLPPAERRKLKAREARLLKKHEREWLGELAPVLFEENISESRRKNDKISRARWARGWVEDLYLWWLDLDTARALANCPATRLLRRLEVDHSSYADEYEARPEDGIPKGSENPNLYPLAKATFLPHLRFFRLGAAVDFERDSYNSRGTSGEGLPALAARMTRLEELHVLARDVGMRELFALPNLTHLRVLLVYHDLEVYPLKVLASNPALRNLTTLRLHPAHSEPGEGSFLRRAGVRALLNSPHLPALTHLHLHASDLGDEGCKDVVKSGILKRLKVLDLRHGCITDKGARTLASCPDVKRLELLSLEDNELTDEGRELLRGLGIGVRCQHQYEVGSEEYLYSGDME